MFWSISKKHFTQNHRDTNFKTTNFSSNVKWTCCEIISDDWSFAWCEKKKVTGLQFETPKIGLYLKMFPGPEFEDKTINAVSKYYGLTLYIMYQKYSVHSWITRYSIKCRALHFTFLDWNLQTIVFFMSCDTVLQILLWVLKVR